MVDPGPMVEILNEYHKAGRIGAFGGSNWTHQRIAEANAYASKYGLVPFTVSSPNFGLCNQIDDPWGGGPWSVTISGPAKKKQEHGIVTIIFRYLLIQVLEEACLLESSRAMI